MKKNELKVTIGGLTSSGKSTIAKALIDLLGRYGIDYSHTSPDNVIPNKNLDEQLKAIAKRGVRVDIIEEQAERQMERPKQPSPKKHVRGL